MWFQPLIYFTAVAWAVGFALFGIYFAVRRAPLTFTERAIGLLVSLLIGGMGGAIVIGIFYLVEELF